MPSLPPAGFRPMEARRAEALPAGAGWSFEPKWDGFRALAVKQGGKAALWAKSGRPLGRYFPEVLALLEASPLEDFVADGELLVERAGVPDFDALQLRLHPAASRVRRLAAEQPAGLVLFDLPFAPGGENLTQRPLAERRAALRRFLDAADLGKSVRLSPVTTARRTALAWLRRSGAGACDGVVAKRVDEPYCPGERAMVKVKRRRSADCVVGGFRYLRGKAEVGSLLLGLYDAEGRLHHVGFTSTIPAGERAALTGRLEGLRGGPGFTGRAPGGPSRWSDERSAAWEPLRPRLVVEVRFDQVTGGRFRHGTTLLRWRPDKAPAQCTLEQLGG